MKTGHLTFELPRATAFQRAVVPCCWRDHSKCKLSCSKARLAEVALPSLYTCVREPDPLRVQHLISLVWLEKLYHDLICMHGQLDQTSKSICAVLHIPQRMVPLAQREHLNVDTATSLVTAHATTLCPDALHGSRLYVSRQA